MTSRDPHARPNDNPPNRSTTLACADETAGGPEGAAWEEKILASAARYSPICEHCHGTGWRPERWKTTTLSVEQCRWCDGKGVTRLELAARKIRGIP